MKSPVATCPVLGVTRPTPCFRKRLTPSFRFWKQIACALLCRLTATTDDAKSPATLKKLWQLSEELLPTKRVGDFNQALMELGAVICTPKQPLYGMSRGRIVPSEGPRPYRRDTCPCAATKAGIRSRDGHRRLAKRRGFPAQRPATGRWGEMWEFPRVEVQPGQSPEDAAAALLDDLGFEVNIEHEVATIRHGVTRLWITLVCLEGRYRKGTFRPGRYLRGEWLAPAQLADYPVSTPQRRLATIVQQDRPRLLF